MIRLNFDELGEHPYLDLEQSVPGPNTVARLNIALDAATSAGKGIYSAFLKKFFFNIKIWHTKTVRNSVKIVCLA